MTESAQIDSNANWYHWIVLCLGITGSAVCANRIWAEDVGVPASEPSTALSKEEPTAFFEREIRPRLVEHCYECHGPNSGKGKGNLRLDSSVSIFQGGDSGSAIQPHDAKSSLFAQSIRYEAYEMPPKGKLPEVDIALFEKWIAIGAPWPAEISPDESNSTTTPESFNLDARKASHWVWQPISNPPVPSVIDKAWAFNSLDCFIQSKLEQEGLKLPMLADRETLLRRLFFDITGLPSTPEALERFLADASPTAYDKAIDELLSSPDFGERWGRHWLDLVRFAESRGHEFDNDAPYAYQYRDYVIRALNLDIDYHAWITEHIAGDLLTDPRSDPSGRVNESILGTGFWHLGEWIHSPVDTRKDEADRFDNMIDVFSKTFLGITVACARCHDHKFDAISTADYYALTGFLQSSDYREARFESLKNHARIADELERLDIDYRTQIQAVLDRYQVGFEKLYPISTARNVDRDSASKNATQHDGIDKQPFVIADYTAAESASIIQDGSIFPRTPSSLGQINIDAVDNTDHARIKVADHRSISNDQFWDVLQQAERASNNQKSAIAMLPRSSRTLRTETFQLNDATLDCLIRGRGHIVVCVDSHRMIGGPLHGDTVVPVQIDNDFQWLNIKLERYIGHRIHLEFTPAVNSQIELRVVAAGCTTEFRDQQIERLHIERLSTSAYREAIVQLRQAHNDVDQEITSIARAWAIQRKLLQQSVDAQSKLALTMIDGSGEDDAILIRGNSSKPGLTVPRRFLAALDGTNALAIQKGSGRKQLADRICDDANPLSDRVIVNRIWHHLMGRGIVPTTDDFGVLGQRPTHPELLDHLTSKFREQGRSIKSMIRYIAASAAYRESGVADPENLARDPANIAWHYRPPKRLQGESLRDTLLFISGSLDRQHAGESVPVYLTSFMDGRGRPKASGPLDGAGRRSIYLEIRRNFLSPWMLAFDTPAPFSAMGRRNVSNVPAQALMFLNDPFVVEISKRWSDRSRNDLQLPLPISDNTDRNYYAMSARVEWLYRTAFSRNPTDQETAAAIEFIQSEVASSPQHNIEEAWRSLSHALLNTKDFMFVR